MNAEKTDLEAMTTTPSGGLTPRCQEIVKRTGKQCARPARKGFDVCSKHGAGTATQEASGTYTPVGRPSIHGLYSKRESTVTPSELTEEVYQTEDALENSDRDLAALKGTAWFLKERLESYLPQVDAFEDALMTIKHMVQRPEGAPGKMNVQDAREIAQTIRAAGRALSMFEAPLKTLVDVQLKTITAHKVRAETKAKLAEAQALETFGNLCTALLPVFLEVLPERAMYDALEARIRREVLAPVKVELPN